MHLPLPALADRDEVEPRAIGRHVAVVQEHAPVLLGPEVVVHPELGGNAGEGLGREVHVYRQVTSCLVVIPIPVGNDRLILAGGEKEAIRDGIEVLIGLPAAEHLEIAIDEGHVVSFL